AVAFLLERFPMVRSLVESEEDLSFAGPYTAYELLADEVLKRFTDEDFMCSIGRFIDDLAESNDHTLTDVLAVSLLEGIASDPGATTVVKQHIGPKAQTVLTQIETEIYGRQGGAYPAEIEEY